MNFLRSSLYDITQNHDLATHAERIEALRRDSAHSIQILPDQAPPNEYNCVMHALGLSKDDFDVPALAASQTKTRFIDFLIGRGYLIPQSNTITGSLIVYSMSGAAQHIGRMISNSRVESKWGTGHLYEHAIWEVPCSYGDHVAFFDPIDHELVLDYFCECQKSAECQ